jgi:hypothetical protein
MHVEHCNQPRFSRVLDRRCVSMLRMIGPFMIHLKHSRGGLANVTPMPLEERNKFEAAIQDRIHNCLFTIPYPVGDCPPDEEDRALKYTTGVLVGMLVLSSPCVAAPLNAVPALGVGNASCRDWIRSHHEHDGRDKVLNSWLLGFFSGRNAFAPSPKSYFFYYDEQHLLDAVMRHCKANPSVSIYETATLFLRLLKRPTGPKP